MAVLEVSNWEGDLGELEQIGFSGRHAPVTGLTLARLAGPATHPEARTAGVAAPAAPRKRYYVLEPLGVWVKRGKLDGSSHEEAFASGGDEAGTAAAPLPAIATGVALQGAGSAAFTPQAAPVSFPLPCPPPMCLFPATAPAAPPPLPPPPAAGTAAAAAAPAATAFASAPCMQLSPDGHISWTMPPPTSAAVAPHPGLGFVGATAAAVHPSIALPAGVGPYGSAPVAVHDVALSPAGTLLGSAAAALHGFQCSPAGRSAAADGTQPPGPSVALMAAPQTAAWQQFPAGVPGSAGHDSSLVGESRLLPLLQLHLAPPPPQQQQQQQQLQQWLPLATMPPPPPLTPQQQQQLHWQPFSWTPPRPPSPPLRRRSSGLEQLQQQVWRCWEMWQQELQQQGEQHGWQQQQQQQEGVGEQPEGSLPHLPATGSWRPLGPHLHSGGPTAALPRLNHGEEAPRGQPLPQLTAAAPAGPTEGGCARGPNTAAVPAPAPTAAGAGAAPSAELWRAWGLAVVGDRGAGDSAGGGGDGGGDIGSDDCDVLSLLGSLRELLGSQSQEGLFTLTSKSSTAAVAAAAAAAALPPAAAATPWPVGCVQRERR